MKSITFAGVLLVLSLARGCDALKRPGNAKLRTFAAASCSLVENYADRFDCYPGYNATQSECETRGCCWDPVPNQNTTGPHRDDYPDSRYPIHVGIPACYYPPDYPSYSYVNQTSTKYGYEALLTRNPGPSSYPAPVANVKINVYFETKSRLRIKVSLRTKDGIYDRQI